MKEFFENLKNKPKSVTLPLVVILIIVVYLIINSVVNYYNFKKIENEMKDFKFKVSKVYFETRFKLRSPLDTFLILELENPISKDQFHKLSFDIPDEKVSGEYVTENKIKIYLNGPFVKDKASYLNVSFYTNKVYRFDFKNSSYDAQDVKNNPISEPDKY